MSRRPIDQNLERIERAIAWWRASTSPIAAQWLRASLRVRREILTARRIAKAVPHA